MQKNHCSVLSASWDDIKMLLALTYVKSATLARDSLKQANNGANGVTKASIKTKMGRNHANTVKLASTVLALGAKTVRKGGIALIKKMLT
jgi:hypothetical protein